MISATSRKIKFNQSKLLRNSYIMHHPNNFYGQDKTTLKDTKKEWLVTLVHGRYKANKAHKEKNRGKKEKGS